MNADDATILPLLLDRYRVEGVLGEGGLGSVVRAYDTRLRRTVAIKNLKRSLASIEPSQYRALEDRFSREAIAGSRMGSHPNLVAVYDFVGNADEILYLILEYVPGGTLAHRLLDEGTLPLADALRLTADIARGLQAAHDAGLVHRDIKPANIFLAADGRAQVGDFGIAQIDDVSGRTHTAAGHPGTPLYMSPEQASSTGYLRPAADQYSLGLVLFEMLTGTAYKRMSRRDVAGRLSALPRPIAALIQRLVAEDPEDRFPDMTAVVSAVQAISAVLEASPDLTMPPYEPEPFESKPYQSEPPATLLDPPPSLQPALPVQPPVQYPPQSPDSLPPPQAPRRMGRRVALIGLGGIVVAGAAGGGYLFYERTSGGTATATPPGTAGGTTAVAGAGTVPPTVPAAASPTLVLPTATSRPTATPGPTSTPVVAKFSDRVIADALSHPEQWQMDKIPNQSVRTLENGTYSVRVSKKPDGSGLFSWGDWVPPSGVRGKEFTAEVEMRLQGDAMGAAGGFIFLYNYVSNAIEYQYLNFMIRGDGRFTIAQQLPGGEGHDRKFIDWAQHGAIKAGTNMVNLMRVEVRQGKFSCYINNQPAYLDQPVPVEVSGFSALSFAADVLKSSVEPDATAIFSKLRYEKVSS